MSIICYTGLPGDGKSYSAVENVVIPALKEGRHVAHNLMLNELALTIVCGREVASLLHQLGKDDTPQQVIEKCPPGAVIVLDEVWRYWPAGVKANEVPKDELKFFKEHRHRVGDDGLSTEILIIDQDPGTGVPAFLRSLIEVTYIHTKHTKVGAKGRFRVDVYTRCQSAVKPSKGAFLRSLQGRYRPEVWNCYVSHTQAKRIGEAGLEKMPDDRGNILKGWTIRAAVVALIALPFLFWFASAALSGMVKGGGLKAGQKPSQVAAGHGSGAAAKPAHPPSTQPQIAPPAPADTSAPSGAPDNAVQRLPGLPPISGTWRILAVVWKPDGMTGRVLLSSANGRRMLDVSYCKQDDSDNWRCDVEDGQATMWSGAANSNPLSASQNEGLGDSATPMRGTPSAQSS